MACGKKLSYFLSFINESVFSLIDNNDNMSFIKESVKNMYFLLGREVTLECKLYLSLKAYDPILSFVVGLLIGW